MRIPSQAGRRVVAVAAAMTLAATGLAHTPTAAARAGGVAFDAAKTQMRLIPSGRGNLRAIAQRTDPADPAAGNMRRLLLMLPGVARASGPASDITPNPRSVRVAYRTPGFRGFPGLRSADSRLANHGNQFDVEPPDQALCVGNGQVLEGVNLALTVYRTNGTQQIPVTTINQFFGLPPNIRLDRGQPIFGPLAFDPLCHFDQQVRRWFFVVTEVDLDRHTGQLTGGSHLFVAVSKTADAAGDYAFSVINTSPGDATDRECPCFDDFPQIGADAHGFFITTNRFAFSTGRFNGAQIYAVAKRGLAAAAAGGPLPVVVSFDAGSVAGAPAIVVHPAITPPGGAFPRNREYFLSTAFANSDRHRRIAVWAVSNTASLDGAHPRLRLSHAVIDSLDYVLPPKTVQKPGQHPLGQSVGEPVRALDSGREVPRQVTFAAGRLWSSVDTAVGTRGGPKRTGVLWLVVTPTYAHGAVGGRVTRQGYLAVDTNSLLYGAVAVNAHGRGALVMSLAGPTAFPSAAYAEVRGGRVTGPVRVAARGKRPYDGATCYRAFVGDAFTRGCRWGDYSAARADDRGRIWVGTEYVPNLPRVEAANWGTFVGRLVP